VEAPPTQLLNRAFLRLTAGHALQAVGYTTMLLFPLHLERLGATRSTIGLLTALAGASGLLSRPMVARALDLYGARRTIALSTLALALSIGLAGLVDTVGPLVICQRVLFGVSVGALFTAYFKAAADWIPPSQRTRGIALFGLSGILPLLILPLVGAAGEALGAGIVAIYPWAACVIGLSGLLAWPVQDAPRAAPPAPFTWQVVVGAMSRPGLRPVWIAAASFSCMVSVFMTFSTVSARKAGLEAPAALWFWYALGSALVRTLGGGLPDRLGPTRLVVPSMTAYIAGLAGVALAESELALSLATLVAGVGHGYCFPVLMGLVIARSDEASRANAVATYTAIWGTLELVAPPLFGLFADEVGDAAMFGLVAVVGAAGTLRWARVERALPASLRAS
jgi:MFS family permease